MLLRHAYVTMRKGPNSGWKFAEKDSAYETQCPDELDALELSKPLASNPNHRSSIHQATVLNDQLGHLSIGHSLNLYELTYPALYLIEW